MTQASETRLNLSAGMLSSATALVLVLLKLWALAETSSLSVAATLVDSALDLMMSLGGLAAIAYAARPPDEDHAFGHGSAEDLAALGQSALILVSAAVIAASAVLRLLSDSPPEIASEGRGLVVLAISIALTAGLVLWQGHVARTTGSRVVAADRLHYLSDLLPNLGAVLALVASAAFGLSSIDSVVALAAAALLSVGSLRIGKGAWDALMDRAADDDTIAGIERIAAEHPGVLGHHDLKTRQSGTRLFVNLHIELDGAQSLDEAHAIGAALRRAILRTYPNADVLIHKDPAGAERHPDDPRETQT
ncbi:cation diffusion facilitator family transporter [Histidinibacterium aquaticum]|uniref:Cation diffusion facilitator family transporter n=1 Tax=Histidinibacterium aquaticum TaxID=2613962 RepID=A0A5J5GQJ4_9RHOB|nr:cation diffusion facilitator family transporter [Histidinibacterium aquaticum]KAA9010450.1 cation diffusion facilitator family transporter [Histidinibacterium aquaticum]